MAIPPLQTEEQVAITEIQLNTGWRIAKLELNGLVLLSVKDHQQGWRHYHMTDESLATMYKWLSENLVPTTQH